MYEDYQLPFFDVVQPDPSIEEMKKVCNKLKKRKLGRLSTSGETALLGKRQSSWLSLRRSWVRSRVALYLEKSDLTLCLYVCFGSVVIQELKLDALKYLYTTESLCNTILNVYGSSKVVFSSGW